MKRKIDFTTTDKFGHPFIKGPVLFYKISVFFQWAFWKIGLPYHNHYADECTPDFNCCIGKSKTKLK